MAMTLLGVVFDGWLWEVDLLCSTLAGWFNFCDSRVLAGYSDFGVRIERVVLFPDVLRARRGWDWRTPWNVLLYDCASPDR